MTNTATIEFAGDPQSLRRASQVATEALNQVEDATAEAAAEMESGSSSSTDLTTKLGHLGSAVDGATTAIDSISGSLQALSDLQNLSANRAAEQKRKLLDVEQAAADLEQANGDLRQSQLDLNQSFLDAKQGQIDAEQALIDAQQAALDAKAAQDEYNKAVKEHGKNSDEAKQAAIDLRQANADLTQANLDGEQAQADIKQAMEDGNQAKRDGTQASIDARSAQLDLNDAQRAAHPPELQKWADNLQLITPLITAVVGILGLVTAAQWVWNASLWASPITWIVLGIVALIAVIVLIATKTTWFQDLWRVTWGWIKDAAEAVGKWFVDTLWGVYIKGTWDGIVAGVIWLKDNIVTQFNAWKSVAQSAGDFLMGIPGRIATAFKAVTNAILWPFKTAFNMVSTAWNNTVGRLSWTIPGWVPVVGGNSISAPKLPQWHTGGIVPGSMGQEVLAVLKAGERVTAGVGSGGESRVVIDSAGSRLDDLLLEVLQRAISKRGGDVQRVLGTTNG
jgi:hypothetical protein